MASPSEQPDLGGAMTKKFGPVWVNADRDQTIFGLKLTKVRGRERGDGEGAGRESGGS